MAERSETFATKGYRFGFNGQEGDDEVSGEANSYDFGARIYDSRLGRFLSVDPLQHKVVHQSSYVFAGNEPIWAIDKNGEIRVIVTTTTQDETNTDGTISTSKQVQYRSYIMIDEIFGVYRSTVEVSNNIHKRMIIDPEDPNKGIVGFNYATQIDGGLTAGEAMNGVQYGILWAAQRIPIVGPASRAMYGSDVFTGRYYSKIETVIFIGTAVTDIIGLARISIAATSLVAKKRGMQMLLTKVALELGIYKAGEYTDENYAKVAEMLYEYGLADDVMMAFLNGYMPFSKRKLSEVFDAFANGEKVYKSVDELKTDLKKEYKVSTESDFEEE